MSCVCVGGGGGAGGGRLTANASFGAVTADSTAIGELCVCLWGD